MYAWAEPDIEISSIYPFPRVRLKIHEHFQNFAPRKHFFAILLASIIKILPIFKMHLFLVNFFEVFWKDSFPFLIFFLVDKIRYG